MRPGRRPPPWLGVAAALFAVGWGANQFAAMLVVYRQQIGVSAAGADALFGLYALGLIPALLVGGPLSDRYGRAMVRPCAALSVLATLGLIAADRFGLPVLCAGRLLAGIVSGLVFAPGTAWVKELSVPPYDNTGEQAGARRAAVALTSGFALGPAVAGVLGQYAPHPLVVPYLPHLVVIGVALLLVRSVPETRPATSDGPSLGARLRVGSARLPRFLGVVAPMAPWVFAAPSVTAAVLPGLLAGSVAGRAVVFGGLLTGGTLLVGVLVQPWARRLDAADSARGAVVGLAAVVVGALTAAAAAAAGSVGLAVLAAVALGAGYGCCLVAGLLEVQRLAPPDQLAGLTAVYYALTYVGFALPYVLAGLASVARYPALLGGTAGLALLTLALVALASGRLRAAGPV